MKKEMNWNLKMTAGWTISFILIHAMSLAQVAPDTYFIKFTDKNNSPYSINQPGDFLSQRAIDRRNEQNIAILNQDLPVNPQYLDSISLSGVKLHYPLKWFNGAIISTQDSLALNAILQYSFVNAGESFKTSEAFEDHDNSKLDAVHVSRMEKNSQTASGIYDYGYAENQVTMMNVQTLHDEGYIGSDVWIAVIDAGFAGVDTLEAFQHIYAENRLLATRDFVDGGSISYNKHTHGTYVLSCMGALQEGTVVGTSPGASFALLRTEDGSQENMIEEFNWVAAAEFADSLGVDVFNTSLGYTTYDYSPSYSYTDLDGNSSFIVKGADIAASKGILVVNSAGNYGASAWYYIGTPADGDSVLAIGATNSSGWLENFSSRGPSADGRLKPNVVAQGGAVAVTDFSNDIAFLNGTSFSGPLVAGAAASLWQKHPTKGNMEIFHAIEYSSSHYSWGENNEVGWGIPNFENIDFTRTSIDQIQDLEESSFYPNPTNGILTFKNPNTEETQIRIYSNQHLVLEEVNINRHAIDLSHLSNGLYIVEIQKGSSISREKLIKH